MVRCSNDEASKLGKVEPPIQIAQVCWPRSHVALTILYTRACHAQDFDRPGQVRCLLGAAASLPLHRTRSYWLFMPNSLQGFAVTETLRDFAGLLLLFLWLSMALSNGYAVLIVGF